MMKITAILAAISAIASPALADVPPDPLIPPAPGAYEQACEAETITLYFAHMEADLTYPALRALEAKLGGLEQCSVTHVQTAAISTDAGSQAEKIQLSEARTDRVLQSLAAAGIMTADIQTDIVIARNTHRAAPGSQPPARRVDVTLLTAPAISS